MVPAHGVPVGGRVGLEQAGAALQVGEQEGDGAGGEVVRGRPWAPAVSVGAPGGPSIRRRDAAGCAPKRSPSSRVLGVVQLAIGLLLVAGYRRAGVWGAR